MSDDVRDLLVEIAPEPSRGVDVDGLLGTARRRRRRGRTLSALAGVLVVAVVAAGVAALAGGGGSSQLAVRSGGPGLEVPAGWTPLNVDDTGISLAIPPGWSRYPEPSASTRGFVVGSATPPNDGAAATCSHGYTVPTGTAGTWVVLAEFPAGSTSVKDSFGGSAGPIGPRPADFRTGFGAQGDCSTETLTSTTAAIPATSTSTEGSYTMTAFTDSGRVFLARVVTVGTTDQAQERRLGAEVLNTLHIEPVTRSDPNAIPAGWTKVALESNGISLAIPPGWQHATPGNVAEEDVVVGTSDRPSPGPIAACVSTGDPVVGITGTWVSLYEFPAGSTSLAIPGGDTIDGPVPARPPDFRIAPGAGGSCRSAPGYRFEMFAFTDAGRTFVAHVTQLGGSDTSAFTNALQVLNTLHVDAGTASTTTTAPEATTTTAPGSAVAGTNGGGFFNPSSADQQQIEQALLGWLRGKTLDAASRYIEDFPSIRDAEAQGIAQHTPQDLAGFDGRVESVVIADPTHADVVYTLLHDGQPLYANRSGKAVKVGGTWKVTRDTACGLLSMGGITCPPRTTPAP